MVQFFSSNRFDRPKGLLTWPIMALYFFPRVNLYNFFLFLLIYGGLGFGALGLGSYFGFLGLGLSVDGV